MIDRWRSGSLGRGTDIGGVSVVPEEENDLDVAEGLCAL